ncbi:C40 family peptidase [Nocardioides alcanivorans]|uniref:C40 family peptidase n=1 Tax=Nocardioides alcanivorans TaxID=2897352 RepID=UPI001F15962C|nr:C40 family peptidase [Nocardioides alcanivorans]
MRRINRLKLAVPVAVLGLVVSGSALVQAAAEPDGDAPSKSDVRRAERAASDASRDVSAVRTELVLAQDRAEQASVRTAAAFEAWNAARWEAREARTEAAAAAAAEKQALADLKQRRSELDTLLVGQYESAPELSALGAIADADSVEGVLTQANTYYGTSTAIRDLEAAEDAAAELAGIATADAAKAQDRAEDLAAQARVARTQAQQAEQAALREAQSVAAEKERLVSELARLQGVSVSLATRRQNALEERARVRARKAAEQESRAQQAAQEKTDRPVGSDEPSGEKPGNDVRPGPAPDPAPAPSGSVDAVIAFARAQIGDTYVWGAAGPNAWDCSGLTMAAWGRGGASLPHYSAGQYAASTPISAGNLKRGDLVFWGTTSDPSSIHHVALYVGDGKIVHAPRTGRPVTEESMYYWIPPNFFARP